jgi:hypothetical protein
MRLRLILGTLSLIGAFALTLPGCDPGDKTTPKTGDKEKVAQKDDKAEADAKHAGWWCKEHGIPEAECSMCSEKVAKEFKAKGDWCDKHDRAQSQCFKCDPKLKEKYAAMYRAKFGKEPPPIEDDEEEKKDNKKGSE